MRPAIYYDVHNNAVWPCLTCTSEPGVTMAVTATRYSTPDHLRHRGKGRHEPSVTHFNNTRAIYTGHLPGSGTCCTPKTVSSRLKLANEPHRHRRNESKLPHIPLPLTTHRREGRLNFTVNKQHAHTSGA